MEGFSDYENTKRVNFRHPSQIGSYEVQQRHFNHPVDFYRNYYNSLCAAVWIN